MKPHPRPPYIRKTVKWGGAAVTVLLVVVWIGSGWWYVECGWGSMSIMSEHGLYAIDHDYGDVPASLQIAWHRPEPVIRFWRAAFYGGNDPTSSTWRLVLPAWIPALIAAVATISAWHLDSLARRRARVGLCLKCNYNRAGLAAGAVCPECGAVPVNG